jgi:hypothetical protein
MIYSAPLNIKESKESKAEFVDMSQCLLQFSTWQVEKCLDELVCT